MCRIRRLEAVSPPREVYTDRHIDGLGKNFLVESNRRGAVESYHFFIRYYALRGLKDRLACLVRDGWRGPVDQLLHTPSDQPIVRSPSDSAIAETHGLRNPCGARKKCGAGTPERSIARFPSVTSRRT